MQTSHQERVERVRQQVLLRPPEKRLTISKAHPGHTPHDLGYKSGCHPVRVGGLGDLCRRTLALGLMPKVVPVFETFTISGLVNGLGIETSSHRHGVFPLGVRSLEAV